MDYEVLFEVVIRYIRPLTEEYDPVYISLISLGLDDLAVAIYKELLKDNILTPEDLASRLGANVDDIVERLDYMYSLGLIDRLGRAYVRDVPLSEAIRNRVVEKITQLIQRIAKPLKVNKDER